MISGGLLFNQSRYIGWYCQRGSVGWYLAFFLNIDISLYVFLFVLCVKEGTFILTVLTMPAWVYIGHLRYGHQLSKIHIGFVNVMVDIPINILLTSYGCREKKWEFWLVIDHYFVKADISVNIWHFLIFSVCFFFWLMRWKKDFLFWQCWKCQHLSGFISAICDIWHTNRGVLTSYGCKERNQLSILISGLPIFCLSRYISRYLSFF